MTDRREFLQYAMVSAMPLAAGVSLEARGSTIRHVVVDARHFESRSFGAGLAENGAIVHTLADGDATDLWVETLSSVWQQGPVAVAGLTRAPALFILEQFAWSHGLRVVYHAEHVVKAAAPAGHHILRSPTRDITVEQLQRLDTLWPDRVADWVAGFSPAASGSRPGPTSAGLLPVIPVGAELLTSWIIAPV